MFSSKEVLFDSESQSLYKGARQVIFDLGRQTRCRHRGALHAPLVQGQDRQLPADPFRAVRQKSS